MVSFMKFLLFFIEKKSLQASPLIETLMCATKSEKINCLIAKSGRLLDTLEHVLNVKRDEVLGMINN